MADQKILNTLNSPADLDLTKCSVIVFDRQNLVSELLQFSLALVGAIILLPLFAIIAILIKLTSPGPILYRGLRVGKARKVFTIYKFRTLQVGSEETIGARLLTEHDTYYTTVGKFLKRTKLDELPQLLNVLRGDMNLVGPRPIRPIFLDGLCQHIPLYHFRFSVKPGMTGLAQIKGGYFTDPKDKLRYELVYIKNRGLVFDIKLILLTFFKLLNRWLTLGLLCLLLFLFVSFASDNLIPSAYIYFFEFRINVLHLFIIISGGWLLAKRIPKGRLYIYKAPINLPILLFFASSFIGSFISLQPITAIRGTIYYMITGFMLVFIIINGETSRQFIKMAVRTIAILTVIVSLLGFFEILIIHHTFIAYVEAGFVHTNLKLPRITSTLGRPVILSTYLVLGFPFLLCELAYADTKSSRDFWLICTTIVFIGIMLTQTRLGLIALAVTGGVFFYRKSKRHFTGFVVGCGILFLIMSALGGSHYEPHSALQEGKVAAANIIRSLSKTPTENLLLGIGARNFKPSAPSNSVTTRMDNRSSIPFPPNMHLLLFRENGLIGWLFMMWILGASMKSFYNAYQRVRDPHLQLILWAIFSSVIGFIVSMNGSDAFFNISIQIIFWSILGIGMAIVTHYTNKKCGFRRLWRFGD